MTTEARLLLACARECLDTGTPGEVRAALLKPIGWPRLLHLAEVHAVTPLVCVALQNAGDSVPAAILDELQHKYYSNVVRNLALTGELVRLMRLFDEQEIHAVPFKGPVLASAVYGNLALRVFDDLDILVRREDTTRARALLLSCCYHARSNLDGPQERMRFHWNSQLTFARADDLFHIDLHWGLLPRHFPFSTESADIWRNLVPVCVAGTRVLTLSPEDLLLYLCAHGSKHVWQRLAWACDVAALIRTHTIDWPQTIARAKGGTHMLALGLRLASDLMCVRLPNKTAAWVRDDDRALALSKHIQDRLFEGSDSPAPTHEVLIFNVRSTHGRWRKVRYCLGLLSLPSEADWSMIRLPSHLSFLYYPLRFARLVLKYCRPAQSTATIPMS